MWTHSRAAGKRGTAARQGGDAVIDAVDVNGSEPLTPSVHEAFVDEIPRNGVSAERNGASTAAPGVSTNGAEQLHWSEVATTAANGAAMHPAGTVADIPGTNGSSEAGEVVLRSESEPPVVGTTEAYVPPVVSGPGGIDTVALRESILIAEDKLEQISQRFYSVLFARHPELRELFPAGMEVQRSRLVSALVYVVGNLDNRDDVVAYLEGLGRDHRKFGVISEHYAPLGSALVLAFRYELGDQWTERHENAWIRAYDMIATVMSESAERDAVMWPAWWDAEVVFHRRLLDDLAIIQARPHTDYPYRPGQYCYVSTPRRPKMWRAYSMASAPRDDGLVEFHVRAVGAGWVSSALVWRTEAGDVLKLGSPLGYDLANPRSERDLLCIAGGVGIAPILAGLQELEQRLDGRRVHVFYAGRDRDSLYALPHLESIGVRYRRLTVVPVVSPEGPEDRSPDLMGNIVSAYGDWREHDVYLAGPTTMVQAALKRLREQQIPERQIVCDDFGIW